MLAVAWVTCKQLGRLSAYLYDSNQQGIFILTRQPLLRRFRLMLQKPCCLIYMLFKGSLDQATARFCSDGCIASNYLKHLSTCYMSSVLTFPACHAADLCCAVNSGSCFAACAGNGNYKTRVRVYAYSMLAAEDVLWTPILLLYLPVERSRERHLSSCCIVAVHLVWC